MRNNGVACKIGSLGNIPEDVLHLSILSRFDLKNLCQCLLVSKSFASMIYRTPTLTIKLSGIEPDRIHRKPTISLIRREIICSSRKDIPLIIRRSSMKSLKFYRSLYKFKNLKSIYIEFNSPELASLYSPKRLRLICRSGGSIVESVAALLPASIRKMSSNPVSSVIEELPVNKNNPIEFMEEECNEWMDGSWYIMFFEEWLAVVFLLIKTQDSLECLTVGDFNRSRDDVFVLRGKQLVDWRNILSFQKKITPKYSTERWMHNWQLPISGYLMKETLCMITGLQDDFVESDTTTTWKHNGEKELLSEAITEFKKRIRKKSWVLPDGEYTIVGRNPQTSDGWTTVGKVW